MAQEQDVDRMFQEEYNLADRRAGAAPMMTELEKEAIVE